MEFTPDAEYVHRFDESLSGNMAVLSPDVGMVDFRGSFRCYGTYVLLDLILESFFGSLAAGVYSLLISHTNTMTWAIDKGVAVWEMTGVQINQLVVTFSAETVEYSGTVIATGLVMAGTQNTAAELAALIPQTAGRCKMAPDLDVRLGITSAALGAPEHIDPTEGTLTLMRPLAETHVAGQRGIIAQAPSARLSGTVSLTLHRYTTDQYQTWKAAATRLALRWFFDQENGARSKEWFVPNLTLNATPSPVSGEGEIPQTLEGTLSMGQDSYTAATISAAAADSSINDSAAAFPMTYAGAEIWIAGFTGTVANNQKTTVVSRTANKIVVTGTLVDDLAGESVTIVTRNPLVRVTEA
jgi:hypothetical protein